MLKLLLESLLKYMKYGIKDLLYERSISPATAATHSRAYVQ